MSMAAGARAGARVLQQLRSPTPFFSRAQSLSPSSPPPSFFTPSRGLASDHGHGPAKVNMWEDPMSPGKWKEEHFVFASLAFWGALFYGGFKAATGGKNPMQFVFVSLAGWFSLFYGGYKAATGTSKPKPAAKVEPPPKAGTVLKKTQEKPISKAGDPMVKQVEEIFKKIAEKPVSKMKEVPVPKVKGEKPVPKNEVDVPKRKGERPAPKSGEDTPERKAEKQAPKKKDEKVAEQNNHSSKDKKGGYKLVKVDAER